MTVAFSHGVNGYTNHRCRCEVCVEAASVYRREWRERRKAEQVQRAAEIARTARKQRAMQRRLGIVPGPVVITWIHANRPDCPHCDSNHKIYEWTPPTKTRTHWICASCKYQFSLDR